MASLSAGSSFGSDVRANGDEVRMKAKSPVLSRARVGMGACQKALASFDPAEEEVIALAKGDGPPAGALDAAPTAWPAV